ncbi:hypothetical protein [uncultured Duncaniella sp.]|uniref:hypothetical protein n=1 Tax=uncultured Duncaniella sp. TaxID=2768039 RepID=UPI002675FF40|nr:hypothetical protein [uncultured Duncaniella sp.]
MNTPLFTWCAIVIVMAVMMIIRFATSAHAKGATHHKFFEIGSEREEIFIPGDPIHVDDLKDCGDDDEF